LRLRLMTYYLNTKYKVVKPTMELQTISTNKKV